jgi:3-keto-5-aminohexanoate cleavage enzyme
MQFSIVLGVRGGMAATVDNLLAMVRRLPTDAEWQVVAVGRENLRLTTLALALGGNVRAGLEDTLHIRRGELSMGSRPLVDRAVRLALDLDLDVASVTDAEQMLSLERPVAPAST